MLILRLVGIRSDKQSNKSKNICEIRNSEDAVLFSFQFIWPVK